MISAASLVFPAGKRPTADTIRTLAERNGAFAVSLDPRALRSAGDGNPRPGAAAGASASVDGSWLELLVSGLSYDLTCLAEGPGAATPLLRHDVPLPPGIELHTLEAIELRPGPHLAEGEALYPVLRHLAFLATELAALPDVAGVAWHPARNLVAPDQFRVVVGRWLAGGLFPGPCLASLASEPDGAMLSEGLAPFAGQELRIEPELTGDRGAAARLALRLMHTLAENGPLRAAEHVTASELPALRLIPSANGRFVRVWKG